MILPYLDWEDYAAGMFSPVSPDLFELMLPDCINCMRTIDWHDWMLKVVDQWPISAKYNLVTNAKNRRAWVGQSSMCLWMSFPCSVVKSAWWQLSPDRQRLANCAADRAISLYFARDWRQKLLWEDKNLGLMS